MKYLLCILLPPLACILAGRPGAAVLNVPLTICGWLPGVIHAFFVVSNADADRRNEALIKAVQQSKQ